MQKFNVDSYMYLQDIVYGQYFTNGWIPSNILGLTKTFCIQTLHLLLALSLCCLLSMHVSMENGWKFVRANPHSSHTSLLLAFLVASPCFYMHNVHVNMEITFSVSLRHFDVLSSACFSSSYIPVIHYCTFLSLLLSEFTIHKTVIRHV